MTDYSFLTWSPLITAGVWLAFSAYLMVRERYRTWTEVFFLGLGVFVGGYALSDAVFFNVPRGSDPTLAASMSLACLTLASAFLFLYGMSLHGRFRLPMLLAFAPSIFFILTIPSHMFTGFPPLPGAPTPRVPGYNGAWFVPWLVFLGATWLPGLLQITRTFLEVRQQSPRLARRIAAILFALGAALVAGVVSNGLLGLSSIAPQPPLFSTFLALPGFVIFFATTPNASRRLNEALLRRASGQYDVKGAFLTFSDGTLIGSKVQPEEEMIDADSFSATLDLISNFMRTSFPTLRGKWLKSIRHGDFTLVMERGKHVYLTLVLGGQENDQLRRQILEGLGKFEEENQEPLANWRGMAKDARGVDDLLDSMLALG